MRHFCYLTGLYSRYDVLIFERQGKSLVEAGFRVTYVVCDDKPDETVGGIEIISTGFKPKSRWDRFLNTSKILLDAALKVEADVYQISDPELISLVEPLKKQGKKVVFNMREYYPDMLKTKHYIPKSFRGVASMCYERMMRDTLKKYDAVFVVTSWILDIVQKRWGVTNAYLLTNFPRVSRNYHLSYEEYCQRGDVLCYEGTIYKVSRQENVFKALENLPMVHYILAGKIDENYSCIKDLPYWRKVEFIDGFDLKDLKNIFARSTMANVFRDFGGNDGSLGVIKIFESMEAALPVLLADVPLYKDMVEKYRCGICVDPNNVQQIEDAIRFLVEHKEEAYQMGQSGRQAVLNEYNWENQARNYIEVINSL